MPSILSWGRKPHFSIGGIEVVPATGLEVAFDHSPEVVTEKYAGEKRRRCPSFHGTWKRVKSRKTLGGVPILWIGIGFMAFVVGIVAGGVIASIIARKESSRSSNGDSAASSTSSSMSSMSSSIVAVSTIPLTSGAGSSSSTTLSSPLPVTTATTTSSAAAAAETTLGANATAETNFQTFTGALGGVAAEAITPSGDSARPFLVGGDTFTDFSSAETRACNDQHNGCADIASSANSNGLTIEDCDTQQTQCEAEITRKASSSRPVASVKKRGPTVAPEEVIQDSDQHLEYRRTSKMADR